MGASVTRRDLTQILSTLAILGYRSGHRLSRGWDGTNQGLAGCGSTTERLSERELVRLRKIYPADQINEILDEQGAQRSPGAAAPALASVLLHGGEGAHHG